MKRVDKPLTYEVKNGVLSISIGINTLAFCVTSEPRDSITSGVVITDPLEFAKDVLHALQDEREDGSTLVTDLLDRANAEAYEQGSLGIDYEKTEEVRCCKCRHLRTDHDEDGECLLCDCCNPDYIKD